MRTDVLGVGFDSLTMGQAVERALGEIERRGGSYVVTPNPEIVWMCRRDGELQALIDGAAMVLPDGVGILYGARILGRPLAARVPGIDFVSALFREMALRGQSVFLFGAKPGVAELAGEKLTGQYPGLRLAGTADGYFDDDGEIVARIREAAPDLLLVCLGAPKQERWMGKYQGELGVGLMAGLGGALDVYAGVVERAPERWRRLGLEWLHRLIREPRRIKRMIRLPLFLLAVIGQRLRGG